MVMVSPFGLIMAFYMFVSPSTSVLIAFSAFVVSIVFLCVGFIILCEILQKDIGPRSMQDVAEVIKPDYTDAAAIFGLRRYIQSLKKLIEIARDHPGLIVLPAHRFYYHGRWNPVDLESGAKELLGHHIERCGAIIEILNNGPKTAEEIAAMHFEERLLEGFGNIMAANEIGSHCELLIESGDDQAAEISGNACTSQLV